MENLMWLTFLLISAQQLLPAMSAQDRGLNSQYSQTILVTEDMGQQNTSSSFKCINDRLSDSTAVLFQTRQIWLTTRLIIRNHSNIALQGASETTTVQCEPLRTPHDVDTGLQFIGVTNLTIKDLVFVACGAHYTANGNYSFRGALYILTSENCVIENVIFRNSSGRGLLFINTTGSVSVTKSKFIENKVTSIIATRGQTGIHIRLSKNPFSSASIYKIIDCTFVKNNASTLQHSYYHGEGGGILILFLDSASDYHIHIINSTFAENSAVWGGALEVSFCDSSNSNTLNVINSTFIKNKAMSRTGGALDIGYYFPKGSSPYNNSALFLNCSFTENSAIYGGGVGVYSTKSIKWSMAKDEFKFKDCKWDKNMGDYGSAVDISPQVSTIRTDGWIHLLVIFEDCQFTNNTHNNYSLALQSSWRQYTAIDKGTLSITSFSAQLSGRNSFINNTYSAMYLVRSIVNFSAGSNVRFINNFGYDGGAIALHEISILQVWDNSTFTFQENKAKGKGGAIFVSSIDRHDYISIKSCFIQKKGGTNANNITFHFYKNRAPRGNSIYASSILPCYYHCNPGINPSVRQTRDIRIDDVFNCIGNFNFTNCTKSKNKNYCDVLTSEDYVFVSQREPLRVVPGKEITLPIELKDELNQTINGVYHAIVKKSSRPSIVVNDAYSYVNQRHMKLYGLPGANGTIELSTLSFRKVILKFDVEMLQCPPGFVIESVSGTNGSLRECVCSVNTDTQYLGIRKCNASVAFIQRQYWIGYDGTVSHENLLVGNCPSWLCKNDLERDFALPDEASQETLNDYICKSNHTGFLCSKCTDGYSVHYHSECACCLQDNHCSLGWLFYILSEVVPLTAVFITIMIFNISFTSGAANAFILFAQTLRVTIFNANRYVLVNRKIWHFFNGLHFVYRFFNLEFFTKDELSFCLWKEANSLDILALKYVTVVYGLLLILATVVLMNLCNFKRLFHSLVNPSRVHGCIIHGLTAFLVLCYSQCAKISFEILTYSSLYGIGVVHNRTVVAHYGEMNYFSSSHLKYAIPAIFCISIIVIPPPLLLILYPAHYKLLALVGISESRISAPLEKLKPLFDALQGCYRDNFRFFAGLYFLFRIISEITNALSNTNTQYYTTMITLLSIILVLHTYCRPYVKNWHNILDSMVLLDLLLINVLSVHMYSETQSGHMHSSTTAFLEVQIFQAILAPLPLVYMSIYLISLLVCYIKQKNFKVANDGSGDLDLLNHLDQYHEIYDTRM